MLLESSAATANSFRKNQASQAALWHSKTIRVARTQNLKTGSASAVSVKPQRQPSTYTSEEETRNGSGRKRLRK